MLIDIFLGIIFFGSCFALWYRVSEKIPHVVAIHDEVITQRLHENSARLRIFLLHFKTFYKEEYYHNLFWNFLGKVFYKLHIFILRLDNYIVLILKKIRAHNGYAGLFVREQTMQMKDSEAASAVEPKETIDYWNMLKDDTAAAHHARTPRKRGVEGVRVHVRKSPAKSPSSIKKNEPT